MPRELLVLGTASQAPTRERNQNGYLLRWDDLGILFDPGEGTQRQMLFAGARSRQITHIAVTHQHGDHCWGLPGVLQRMALDQRDEPVTVLYPAVDEEYMDRLLGVGLFESPIEVIRRPVPEDGMELDLGRGRTLSSLPLEHRVPAVGFRLQQPPVRRFVPELLEHHDLEGPVVGRLQADGHVDHGGRRIDVAEVSVELPGQAAAFVMDTRVCAAAEELIHDTDLAVLEATFRDGDEEMADRYGHLTASQAGLVAARAGVRRLVVTHFSQRYPDAQGFADEAGRHHPDVVAAVDLETIEVPHRPGVDDADNSRPLVGGEPR